MDDLELNEIFEHISDALDGIEEVIEENDLTEDERLSDIFDLIGKLRQIVEE